jgi:hypothetical protein
MSTDRWKPSPAMLVALLALFLAVGGGAFAAGGLVTSAGIKNGTIKERDLAPTLRAKIARTAKPGPAGARGPAGANGVGPASITYVQGADVPLLVFFGREATLTVMCPAGAKAVSGGLLAVTAVFVKRSEPIGSDGVGWRMTVRDELTPNGLQNVLTPIAVCVSG